MEQMPTPVTNGPEGQPQMPSAEKRDTIPTQPPAMEMSAASTPAPEQAPVPAVEQELPPTVPTEKVEAPSTPDTIPTPPGMEMADTMRASAPEAEMPPTVPTPKEEAKEEPSALQKFRNFFGF